MAYGEGGNAAMSYDNMKRPQMVVVGSLEHAISRATEQNARLDGIIRTLRGPSVAEDYPPTAGLTAPQPPIPVGIEPKLSLLEDLMASINSKLGQIEAILG